MKVTRWSRAAGGTEQSHAAEDEVPLELSYLLSNNLSIFSAAMLGFVNKIREASCRSGVASLNTKRGRLLLLVQFFPTAFTDIDTIALGGLLDVGEGLFAVGVRYAFYLVETS